MVEKGGIFWKEEVDSRNVTLYTRGMFREGGGGYVIGVSHIVVKKGYILGGVGRF